MKESMGEHKHLNELMGDDLDIEQAWEELNRRRKRRFFPFWLFGALFCCGVGMCLLYHLGEENMGLFIAKDSEKIQESSLTTSDNSKVEDEEKLTTEFIKTVQQSTISNSTNLEAKEKENLLSNDNQSIVEKSKIIKKNNTNDNTLESTIIPEIMPNNQVGIGQKSGTIHTLKDTATRNLAFNNSINNNASKELKDKQIPSNFQVGRTSQSLLGKKNILTYRPLKAK